MVTIVIPVQDRDEHSGAHNPNPSELTQLQQVGVAGDEVIGVLRNCERDEKIVIWITGDFWNGPSNIGNERGNELESFDESIEPVNGYASVEIRLVPHCRYELACQHSADEQFETPVEDGVNDSCGRSIR